ncbi:MAG: phytanoyl-CoA dioxygenase family protein [Gemmataceae bacterium]|nr:phytanoyl-CoA dioxygenase family protein [Gemmataceae bacterium]
MRPTRPRLVGLVSARYGEPAHLFKDKLIFKPPGAKGYDLHQADIGRADFPESFVTAAVAVDPCGKDNGATEVFPGYHRRGYLSPKDGDYHNVPDGAVDESDGGDRRAAHCAEFHARLKAEYAQYGKHDTYFA